MRLILVSVGLAALIMILVAVNIWTRTKEKQTQMDEINVRYDVDDGWWALPPDETYQIEKEIGKIKFAKFMNNKRVRYDVDDGLLRLILVSVGLAALIMIVVAVNIWTRTKEKQTQMDEINVRYDVDDGTVNYENIRPPDGV
ncbi:hypothetical protein F7725_019985 [Dissostichus mawsoni]|uniref:Uncharacterized protein n=1 Tax=Dissostichus mawsoni TaxID=36200 RepID=A0A7J5YL95_DISMA|nr:hypothetical protein F7725_019985 [Dissostichus mawsoni]